MADKALLGRYKPFPEHDTPGKGMYTHSFNLPNPNVVRIEVLSPMARKRYLGMFFGELELLRTTLVEQLMPDDANRPFYAIFDPQQTGDIGFDLRANWESRGDATFAGLAKTLEKLPGVGFLATRAADVSGTINKLMSRVGIDNTSTGTGTLKSFSKADLQFNKNVRCSWYMPEMEAQARVSIARLLKIAYVRNFDQNKNGDYVQKIATALKTVAKDIKEGMKKSNQEAETAKLESDEQEGGGGTVTNAVRKVGGTMVDYTTTGLGALAKAAGLGINQVIQFGLKANETFGGSITFAPFPVRLTLGHILDIEPLVITNVQLTGSKEQFMTEDGSNIPLFVNANIQFETWLTPDPNKGFIRWLGDDVFNLGYIVGESEKDPPKTDVAPPDSGGEGKNTASGSGSPPVGAGSNKSNPGLKK